MRTYWSYALMLMLALTGLTSCSEEDENEDEFANWQERNEAFFASLEDSLSRDAAHWQKIRTYSKNADAVTGNTDYIYAHIIEQGEGIESPTYTDSVRVSYQGHLMPTDTYPEGFVFDSTVYGTFDAKTNATTKFLVSTLTDGFSTALQHMHRGDYWRIYVPCELGYGSAGSGSSIPGYSTLVFDLMLVDFSRAGETMPGWSARRL